LKISDAKMKSFNMDLSNFADSLQRESELSERDMDSIEKVLLSSPSMLFSLFLFIFFISLHFSSFLFISLHFSLSLSPSSFLTFHNLKDLPRTGIHHIFSKPNGQNALRRVLAGFVLQNPDIGYCQSLSMVAATILLVMEMNEEDTLKTLIVFVRAHFPKYFSKGMTDLLFDLDAFHVMFADKLPTLYLHLKMLSSGVRDPPIFNPFVSSWLSSLFSTMLSFPKLLKLWDAIWVEGPDIILRYSLSIFILMERDLLKITSAVEFYSTVTRLPELLQDPECPLFPGHSLLQVSPTLPSRPLNLNIP